MATLIRPKQAQRPAQATTSASALDSGIPAPFPRELMAAYSEEDHLDASEKDTPAKSDTAVESTQNLVPLKDVMPSIVHVQRSCLMTLNNLLSEPISWNPIIPDRRHSMPSDSQRTSFFASDSSSASALQTLLTNLRNHESGGQMIEARQNATEAEQLRELQIRVRSVSSTLSPNDAALVNALTSLLSDLHRLAELQALPSQPSVRISDTDSSSILDAPPPADIFDALTRQLGHLQIERISTQAGLRPHDAPVVESALLWSRIDSELENVVAMCRERTETLPKFKDDHMPPEYHKGDYDDEDLPDYEPNGRASLDDSKVKASQPQTVTADEKMRMDLEAVTMAIDRLYLIAPQLHNQRVELKSSKLAQLEKARQEGMAPESSAHAFRKGKERDVRDLENILELLGRASERTMRDQSVVLDGGIEERTRQREKAKKEALLNSLIEHSDAGRLHDQDAVLRPLIRDPEALLTLPEFMREALPLSERQKDPQTLLSLPEFVKEPIPPHLLPKVPEIPPEKTKKKRHRSLSAPPLAWLRAQRSNLSQNGSSSKGKEKAQDAGFDVIYVAENHENLHHVLIFFTVTGVKPGADVQAEVLPPVIGLADQGDYLIIRSGPHTSLPLLIPAHTTPGKKEVRAQGTHYEIKISTRSSTSTSTSSTPSERSDDLTCPLMDATQLESLKPSAFICASCSLPLIHSSRVDTYRDLPSEHWEELVEAWMCHSDLKVNEQVAERGREGFWPKVGQGLVGGSYILFDAGAMNLNNLHLAEEEKPDENWRLARCLCGAIIGRCQEKMDPKEPSSTFRVLKYAVRPISQTSEPSKTPLSAFIVHDMIEFVQAHASYRFVIRDEEEEKPRILIWLFKPKIRLAYTTPASRAIPKSANILASKVLYKLIKPGETPTDLKTLLNKYPGFPQAEFLSYPMPICRRIAGFLRESSTAYPSSLRTMTGLEVGWLQRV